MRPRSRVTWHKSELIWRGDPTTTSHIPDIEKDFDERFASLEERLTRSLPDFLLGSQKDAMRRTIGLQKIPLLWLLNEREKETPIKRLIVGFCLVPAGNKEIVVKLSFGEETMDGKIASLPTRDIIYLIKEDGRVETT